MKFISKYGLSSRNTPTATFDSLMLTLNSSKISGIAFNVIIVKDDVLIPIDDNLKKKIGFNYEKIFIEKIKKYNIGNKIKKHQIMTIDKIFEIMEKTKSQKIVLLNILDCYDQNSKLIDKLRELEQQYPNINMYLTTECDELKEYLITSSFQAKLGFNSNTYCPNQKFYIVNYENINYSNLKNKEIIVTNIKKMAELKDINRNIVGNDQIIVELNNNSKFIK